MGMTTETVTTTRTVINGTQSAPFIQATVKSDGQGAVMLKPTNLDGARLKVSTSGEAAEYAEMFRVMHLRMKDAEVANIGGREERQNAIDRAINGSSAAPTTDTSSTARERSQ